MKIVLYTYHGDVETTSYFMTQLERQWKSDGSKGKESIEVIPIYYDVERKKVNLTKDIVCEHERLVAGGNTQFYFVTFNFAGIYGDDLWVADDNRLQEAMEKNEAQAKGKKGTCLMVDRWKLKIINILVDHPYHYHAFLAEQIESRLERYMQVCIDRDHIAYMEKYFPMIKMGPFMPSGGTRRAGSYQMDAVIKAEIDEWHNRPYDIVFAATYVWPDYFNVFIDRNGPEYSMFYHSVLDEVLADHNKKLEDVMRRRLTEEVEEEISEDEMRETLGHMQFLDYYIRYKNREQIIKMLAKADFKVHIFGSGWQDMEWEDALDEENGDNGRNNLILHPYVTSEECLEIFSKSKFVCNVLPSFHNGAHDRIFNAMLNGAICITDSNEFLDTILVDEGNALLYNWEEPEKLIEKLKVYLDGEKKDICTQIVKNGYELAKNHTWSERAKLLEQIFFEEI